MGKKTVDFTNKKITPLKLLTYKLEKHHYIFLTGSGGVGKSYLMKELIQTYKGHVLALGSTNLAANNLRGSTVSRLFKLYDTHNVRQLDARMEDQVQKFQARNPLLTRQQIINHLHKDLIDILKTVKVIVIDEISMLAKETFELFFYQLHKYSFERFRDIKIVLVGDFLQLEAVNGHLAFESKLWDRFYGIELAEIKRTDSENFMYALRMIRKGKVDEYVEGMLNHFQEKLNMADLDHLKNTAIFLYPTNQQVTEHNYEMLSRLGDSKETFSNGYSVSFRGSGVSNNDIDSFIRDSNFEETLHLKIGAKVIFIATEPELPDKPTDYKPFFNGLTGTVKDYGVDSELKPFVIVSTDDYEYRVQEFPFQQLVYESNTGKGSSRKLKVRKVLEVTQLPLKIAYSQTIHRSQGMTIRGSLVLDASRIFTNQQFYVGLSRASNPKEIFLKGLDIQKHVKVNPKVLAFYRKAQLETWVGY